MKKTIAQQLNVTEFPFEIKDKSGKQIYWEDSNGYWSKSEYDEYSNEIYLETNTGYWSKSEYDEYSNEIYFENSNGTIRDRRPKGCNGKIVEIDGKQYKLKQI